MLHSEKESKESKTFDFNKYCEEAYRYFSSWLYSKLQKVTMTDRVAELKGIDPLTGLCFNACRVDGTGIYHIIIEAAKLALTKEEYGACCYWYFGPEKSKSSQFALLMIDPKDVEWLHKSKVIQMNDGVGTFSKFLGNNNIFSMKYGTQEWREERNRHLNFLDDKAIEKDMPEMHKIADDYIKKIDEEGKIANLERFTADYTLDVVSKTKLSTSLDQYTKDTISSMITKISTELGNQTYTFIKSILPFIEYFPFNYFIQTELSKLVKLANNILRDDVIQPNKETILSKHNFITAGRNHSDIKLTSLDMINEFKEFLVVGHETTAKLLLFTLMLLADSNHRDVSKKLLREIHTRDKSPREWAKSDFDKVTYLTAIVNEALRLYPPVPIMVNRINKHCTFRDIELRPGDLVFNSALQTHHYKPVWGNDADQFKPERFIEENGAIKEYNEYMFHPFGFNPRKCVGQKFAMLEVKQLVAILVSEYEMSLEKEMHHPFPISSTITMKVMMQNIPLYFEKRKQEELEFKLNPL